MSTFNTVTANPGSGGASFATEQFTQNNNTVQMPVTALVFGPAGGPFTLVGDTGGYLPVNISQIGSASLSLGQNTMANSIPVTIASNQGTFTVTANIGTTSTLALDASVGKLNVAQGATTAGNTGPLIQGSVTTAAPSYTNGLIQPLSLTTAGAVRVDGSGVTQPVSGTVTVLQPTGSSLHTAIDSLPSIPTGSNVIGAVTQSGSWSVIANIGSTNGVALDATLAKLNITPGVALGTNVGPLMQGSVTSGLPTYSTGNINPLSLNTSGGLRVDGSAVTQPVSGTVTVTQTTGSNLHTVIDAGSATIGAVNQAGTWIVQPGNTANTTPWLMSINAGGNTATVSASGALKTDGSAVTQPISGTVTANQGGTWTVATNADVGLAPATAPSKAIIVGAQYNSVAPAPTTGQTMALQTDSSGNLKVNIAAGAAAGGTSSSFGAAFPAVGTAIGATDGTNMKALNVDASGNLKVNLAAGGGSGGTSQVDNAAFTIGTTAITPIGGVFDDTPPTALTLDHTAAVRLTNNRAFHVNLRSQGGTEIVGADNSTNSTTKIPILSARANAASPSWTEGNQVPLSTDLSGALRITGSISASNPSVGTDGSAIPTSSTLLGASDGTNLQPLQVESATNKNLRIGIYSGATEATVTGANALKVDGSAVTQPISGSVTVTQATGTNLHAVLDSLSTTTDKSTITQSLNMTATSNAVTLPINGVGSASVQITGGTWTGTIIFEGNTDGTNWFTINAVNPATGAISTTTTANGQWLLACAGYGGIRARCSVTGTNSAIISIQASSGTQLVNLNNPLPAGSNTIGAVTQASGPWSTNITQVNGSGLSLGQAVMNSSLPVVIASNQSAIPITANSSVNVNQIGGNSVVTGGSNGSLGVGGLAATGTAVTGNPILVGGSDGTNIRNISTTTSGLVKVDLSGTTANSTNVNVAINAALPAGSNAIGTVTANAGTGNFNVIGTASDNSANSTAKLPVISARANAAAPSWTEGNQVPLSTDLAGNLRVVQSGSVSTAETQVRNNSNVWTDVGYATGDLNMPVQVMDFVAGPTGLSATGSVSTTCNGSGSASIQITGTWVATIQFEGSTDGTNFYSLNALPIPSGAAVTSTTANGEWVVNTSGLNTVRARVSAYTSGTATITVRASASTGVVYLGQAIPTGSNTIGAVTQASGPWSQNITQINGSSLALGQTTMSASLPVTIASNQSALSIAANSSVNVNQIGGNAVVTGGSNGSLGVGGLAATGTAVSGNPVLVAGSDGTNARNLSTTTTGVLKVDLSATTANSTNVNVAVATALPAGTNTIGNVQTVPGTTGGCSFFKSISVVNAAQAVKASAGQIYGWFLYNNSTSVVYIKFYNVASGSVTVGTTTPDITIPLPASAAANVSWDNGIAFGTAISIAATANQADNDNTTPGANNITAMVLYK